MNFGNTSELNVPKKIINKIIGQTRAVDIINKASKQRRHVLLIGSPGTGKSMLGKALSELLPKSALEDVLVLSNHKDQNMPLVRTMISGRGSEILSMARQNSAKNLKKQSIFFLIFSILALMFPWWIRLIYGDIMAAASMVSGVMFLVLYGIAINMNSRRKQNNEPKLLIDNKLKISSPYVDATGAHAGALLGDVRHDPFQSGGLGTPAHLRVEPGMIHRANKGVLFIDEIATLDLPTQQELLTAMQEKKSSITGKSDKSAGAMVRTQPVPCDFILVAAGNLDTIERMHPALRSRIRGYGYEVFMDKDIDETKDNVKLYYQFIAQEIRKDGKIPHMSKKACDEIIRIAKKMSGKKNKLTLRLRELGGLIRAAGDLAIEDKSKLIEFKHVTSASKDPRTLENQIANKHIKNITDYQIIRNSGYEVGRVNGLAVIGDSGIVLPIESELTPGGKRKQIIATGKLGTIAKEAISNVSAIILKNFGKDINEKYDVFVQFIQTYEGVEGDSASVSVATAIISALTKNPVDQSFAMTGSLSVRGEVLPVGGVTNKIEAAIAAGLKDVIVPLSNKEDIVLDKKQLKKINIHYAQNIGDVLKLALKKKIKWK